MKFDLEKKIPNEVGILGFAVIIVAMSFLLFAYTREKNELLEKKIEINEKLNKSYRTSTIILQKQIIEKDETIDSLSKIKTKIR
jgi:hypothetical protein